MNNVRKSRKTSVMWKYFTCVDSTHAICRTCNKKCNYRSSVTNLKKHLERKHPSLVIDECPGSVVLDDYGDNSDEKVLVLDGHDYQMSVSNNCVFVSGRDSPSNATVHEEIATQSDENNDVACIQEETPSSQCRKKRQHIYKDDELGINDLSGKKEYFQPDEDSEVNALAIMWAMDLRRMKPDQRIFAKRAIGEILFEGQMGTLHRNSITINYLCHKSVQSVQEANKMKNLPRSSVTFCNAVDTVAQASKKVCDEFLVFAETHEPITKVTT